MAPPNSELTTHQKRVLALYEKLMTENNGSPPTYTQLGNALGIARESAYAVVKTLRDKGFIRERTVRMRLTPKGEAALPKKRRGAA